MNRFIPLLLAATLAGCAVGDRGLESIHQPVVTNDLAYVPGCPDWKNTLEGEHESQSSNYGCATNGNLAAMIADPADLMRGRVDGGGDAELAYRAIKAWREVAPTSKSWVVTVPATTTTGGK